MAVQTLSRISYRGADAALAVLFVAFGLSGFFGLAYEVVWFRLLGLVFESITYSFTVMLATVLCGIAVGAYVLGPLLDRWSRGGRRISLWLVFAVVELGIGCMALFSIRTLAELERVLAALADAPLFRTMLAMEDAPPILAAFLAIVPAMFLSGMTFPLAAAIYTRQGEAQARRVGTLYAANLVGSILGSAVAGFVLLPGVGSQMALTLLAAGSALAGAAVLWAAPRNELSLEVRGFLTLFGVVLIGAFIASTPNLNQRILANRFPQAEVLFYREGLENSVTVVREADGYLTLFTNSRGQSRDEPGLVRFHRLVGHLPAILHPDPRRALIVGMGGGSSAGAISQHPGVAIDVAELSDGVIAAIPFFAHTNYAFFKRPDVSIFHVDARNYLSLTDRTYSVVAGDAIRPNDAGSATLYSLEYFRLVADALEADGLMALWLPPFSDYQYRLIMRTFLAAFPHATLWENGDLLIGAKQPLRVDPAAIERRMQDPTLRAALETVGITSPAALLGKFQAGPDELRQVAGPGPLITDDRPYIEYFRSLPRDGPPDVTRFSRDVQSLLR